MAVQVMEWGYIDWKHVKTENNPRQNMNIGIVVIEPGRHLAEHVHYGQEQLLYVLQGRAFTTSTVSASSLSPGRSSIWRPEAPMRSITPPMDR